MIEIFCNLIFDEILGQILIRMNDSPSDKFVTDGETIHVLSDH
jgi:hypothetical protein